MPALDGIRVLDLSRLIPGPYATMLLADLGADVVKIEDPDGGDYLRGVPPTYRTTNAVFCMLNRGKRSVALNLKSGEGRRLFLELARKADVVVESFRPRVMERLGLGYDDVRRTNERVIYCSITGFGQEGPWRDEPGHDLTYLALAGALGTSDPPSIPGVQIADIGGGAMTAVVAILAALFARERGKGGQRVDVSMLDAVRAWMALPGSHFFAGGPMPRPGEFLLSGGVPVYGVYPTKDGKYVALAALEPKFAQALCDATGLSDLTRESIAALLRTRTRDEWRLAGVPIAPVLTVEEALRDRVEWIDDPAEGRVGHLPFPVRLSATPARAPSRAPQLGEHTAEVLASAGVTAGRLEELRREGVV